VLSKPPKPLLAPVVLALALASAGAGCAHRDFFPGTNIPRNRENQEILDVVDQYRSRLVQRDVEGLLVMASDRYREDSGTPRSDDDYGIQGLKDVLRTRLQRVKSIWYEIELREMRIDGKQAEIDVFLNGSFELASISGDRYRRVSDYHRFVLAREDEKWRFISGM